MIYVFRQIETPRAYLRLCKLNINFNKLFLPLDPCSHVPVTICSILTFSETSISSNSGFWKLSIENIISRWISTTYFHKIDWLIDFGDLTRTCETSLNSVSGSVVSAVMETPSSALFRRYNRVVMWRNRTGWFHLIGSPAVWKGLSEHFYM